MDTKGVESLTCANCAICGFSDERGLVESRLASGEHVVLCGTHDMMHRREPAAAKGILDLKAKIGERRQRRDRRGRGGDELGLELESAFAGSRRIWRDRRRTG